MVSRKHCVNNDIFVKMVVHKKFCTFYKITHKNTFIHFFDYVK